MLRDASSILQRVHRRTGQPLLTHSYRASALSRIHRSLDQSQPTRTLGRLPVVARLLPSREKLRCSSIRYTLYNCIYCIYRYVPLVVYEAMQN